MPPDTAPQGKPARDMAFYERLIRRGIAEADARGSAIDHVTARRLALWLLPHSQDDPDLMRGLIHFARTGGVTEPLLQRLRRQARSPAHPTRPQAAWLLQYTVARGRHLGRIGDNFGAACDQIDRADTLLAAARARHNSRAPEPAWPETEGPRITALARHDPETGTVTLVLDSATADIAMFAIAAHAGEREAHAREVDRSGAGWPDGSYGRRNRQAIAARETRVAARLRAVEQAYGTATGRDTAYAPPEPTRAPRSPELQPGPQTGREAEP